MKSEDVSRKRIERFYFDRPVNHLTTSEVAQELGVTPQYVRQLADAGRLTFSQPNGPLSMRFFPADEVRRLIQRRNGETAAEGA